MKSADDLKVWFSQLPNKLTVGRIAAIPVIMVIYPLDWQPTRILAALVFLAAAITDFFDGYYARKYKTVSRLGALLDPVADKMLMVTGIILIASSGALYSWMAVVLICREIAISGLRLIALEQKLTLEVNQYGKLKTSFQVAAIFFLMINKEMFGLPLRTFGMLSMWAAMILSLYSAYTYWVIFWENFKNNLKS
jgi:CDP-diacylglycerol--glycerol-3-phosphate 3-phosphatidyltransferase